MHLCRADLSGSFISRYDHLGMTNLFLNFIVPGNTDLEQLAKIFNVLGTPTDKNWPGVEFLPNYTEFEAREPLDLRPLFGSSSVLPGTSTPANMDLLKCMLTLNPQKRITASQVRHKSFLDCLIIIGFRL